MNERTSLLPDRHEWDTTAPPFRPKRRSYSDDGVAKPQHRHAPHKRTIRRDVWTILRYRASIRHRSFLQRASYTFEVCVLVLILLNVLLAMRESAVISDSPAHSYVHTDWYDSFLYISTIIFSVEYALRLWSCVEDERFASPIIGRLTWMIRPMSVIDLMVLVPFYLEIFSQHEPFAAARGALTLRGLRLLRVMSFLRLERSYNALKNLRKLFSQKKEELYVVSYLTAVVILTGSTMIFFLENPAQPHVFSSLGVCMWWSVETITSLGYGDIVPITSGGRFFSSILALWGIILFTIPGAILSSGFVEIMLQKQETDKREFQEELRRTFSRELQAVSSNGLRTGFCDSCFSAASFVSSPAAGELHTTNENVQELKQQVERLTMLQHQLQGQMEDQKSQLDLILRFLQENSNASPPRAPMQPPFSEITVPTAL